MCPGGHDDSIAMCKASVAGSKHDGGHIGMKNAHDVLLCATGRHPVRDSFDGSDSWHGGHEPDPEPRTALYSCKSLGKRMRRKMPGWASSVPPLQHSWTLHLAGEPCETRVELLHSRVTGKKEVLVNGKVVFSTREKRLNWSWEHLPSQNRISLRSESGHHQLQCKGFCSGNSSPSSPRCISSAADVRGDSCDSRGSAGASGDEDSWAAKEGDFAPNATGRTAEGLSTPRAAPGGATSPLQSPVPPGAALAAWWRKAHQQATASLPTATHECSPLRAELEREQGCQGPARAVGAAATAATSSLRCTSTSSPTHAADPDAAGAVPDSSPLFLQPPTLKDLEPRMHCDLQALYNARELNSPAHHVSGQALAADSPIFDLDVRRRTSHQDAPGADCAAGGAFDADGLLTPQVTDLGSPRSFSALAQSQDLWPSCQSEVSEVTLGDSFAGAQRGEGGGGVDPATFEGQRVAGEEMAAHMEENARLQALLGVRDVQIAVLQGQLRQCSSSAAGGVAAPASTADGVGSAVATVGSCWEAEPGAAGGPVSGGGCSSSSSVRPAAGSNGGHAPSGGAGPAGAREPPQQRHAIGEGVPPRSEEFGPPPQRLAPPPMLLVRSPQECSASMPQLHSARQPRLATPPTPIASAPAAIKGVVAAAGAAQEQPKQPLLVRRHSSLDSDELGVTRRRGPALAVMPPLSVQKLPASRPSAVSSATPAQAGGPPPITPTAAATASFPSDAPPAAAAAPAPLPGAAAIAAAAAAAAACGALSGAGGSSGSSCHRAASAGRRVPVEVVVRRLASADVQRLAPMHAEVQCQRLASADVQRLAPLPVELQAQRLAPAEAAVLSGALPTGGARATTAAAACSAGPGGSGLYGIGGTSNAGGAVRAGSMPAAVSRHTRISQPARAAPTSQACSTPRRQRIQAGSRAATPSSSRPLPRAQVGSMSLPGPSSNAPSSVAPSAAAWPQVGSMSLPLPNGGSTAQGWQHPRPVVAPPVSSGLGSQMEPAPQLAAVGFPQRPPWASTPPSGGGGTPSNQQQPAPACMAAGGLFGAPLMGHGAAWAPGPGPAWPSGCYGSASLAPLAPLHAVPVWPKVSP